MVDSSGAYTLVSTQRWRNAYMKAGHLRTLSGVHKTRPRDRLQQTNTRPTNAKRLGMDAVIWFISTSSHATMLVFLTIVQAYYCTSRIFEKRTSTANHHLFLLTCMHSSASKDGFEEGERSETCG